ncbi:MAG: amino acid ABC transporter permease [Candidatus Limnocylindrales bacterium]
MTASVFSSFGTRRARLAGCLVLVALVVGGCSSRANIEPHYFWDSIFHPSPALVNGIGLTILISVLAQVIGVVLGVFAAIAKMAKFYPFRFVANLYIWFFRGTPLLVQLMFFYYGFPAAGIFKWPAVVFGPVDILPEVLAGIVILGINEGAYMAEIVRAGILSVDPGQTEASKSLGMNYGQTMRRIVLPQAARVIIPPLGNEFNNMLKTTSLLTVVSVLELYNTTSVAAGHNYRFFELFAGAAVWYLAMTTIWGFVQAWIERKFAKGTGASQAGGAGPRREGFASRFMSLRAPIEQ